MPDVKECDIPKSRKEFFFRNEWRDTFSLLTDSQCRRLLFAVFSFNIDGVVADLSDDSILQFAFNLMLPYMRNKLQAYIDTSHKRAESGRKGGFARAQNAKQALANQAKSSKHKQIKQSQHVYDYVNDNVYVNNKLLSTEPLANCEAIPLNDGTDWKPTEAEFSEWVRLFPALDIENEFRSMRAWCNANTKRRKTKRGVERFVVGWLSRHSDSSRQTGNQKTATSKNQFNRFEQNEYDYDDLEREFEQGPDSGT